MAAPFDPICLFTVLSDNNVEYVLIGGLAAVLHGSTAMTSDADIVPESSDTNLTNLSAALKDLEARIRSLHDPAGVAFDPHPSLLASMAMLNTTTRCGDLDVAFAASGLQDFGRLKESSSEFDIDGLTVNVASLADIIRSKREANRPKDQAVIPILLALQQELEDI